MDTKTVEVVCGFCKVAFRAYSSSIREGRDRYCSPDCARRTHHDVDRIRARFFSNVAAGAEGQCHVWTGGVNGHGYGRLSIFGKQRLAHRIAWFLAHGSWPTLNLLHKCDNTRCVNLEHLFEGTQLDNVRDMDAKGRRITPDRRGERCGKAKLTDELVREIRRARATGLSYIAIGKMFGIDRTNARLVAIRKTWSHVD